ncbi:P-type conjugative transfer protein TrbJ [Burkholderia cenocepacia]|uniref:P-type conjugative transfer protein TrbJ n=1 Tax=Burkholderia cenocepacia TaxID=95486 RepID=UPI002ABE64C9|nr:P-type conjugative transfer protein TrbJ [Burkholderia cenocepacia]
MNVKMKKVLAAKTLTVALLMGGVFSPSVQAGGIPVIDVTNVVQTTISAVNQVSAVQKQIEQYTTQLQQYQNMIQNTLAPAAYVWDQVNSTISKIQDAQNMLSYYKNQVGGIDQFLSRFQDVGYYRTSPCFTSGKCDAPTLQALLSGQTNNSEAVKRANDAVFKSVDQQQQSLATDAANLARLQSQASGAQGQMEAIQAANQLASAQANQLLQIRGMLAAQAQAAASYASNQADKDALMAAADTSFRGGSYTKSAVKSW